MKVMKKVMKNGGVREKGPAGSVRGCAPNALSRVAIAERAYERFLARGGRHGGDLEDWLEAERELVVKARQVLAERAG